MWEKIKKNICTYIYVTIISTTIYIWVRGLKSVFYIAINNIATRRIILLQIKCIVPYFAFFVSIRNIHKYICIDTKLLNALDNLLDIPMPHMRNVSYMSACKLTPIQH